MLRSINAESTSGVTVRGAEITPELMIDREITTWRTDVGRIDVLLGIPDAEGAPVEFDQLASRGERVLVDSIRVAVAAAVLHFGPQAVHVHERNEVDRDFLRVAANACLGSVHVNANCPGDSWLHLPSAGYRLRAE
jgi:hypothetical protein